MELKKLSSLSEYEAAEAAFVAAFARRLEAKERLEYNRRRGVGPGLLRIAEEEDLRAKVAAREARQAFGRCGAKRRDIEDAEHDAWRLRQRRR